MKFIKKDIKYFSAIAILVLLAIASSCTSNDTYDSNDYILTEETNYFSHTVSYDGFTDYPVIIGENTAFPLNGILSMPNNTAQPVPAAVIVHGSGGHDMDGNMFGNAPYRDIAEFLAANGVAVIRHDKRTFVHGTALIAEFGGSFTVWEESIEDAILAANMLRTDPRVDENRVFIIGHSLGGALSPRIHATGGDFAGLILLAGTSRSVPEVVHDQGMAQLEQMPEGPDRTFGYAQLEELAELFAAIPYMSDEEAKDVFVIGASAYYLRDVEVHSFENYIGSVTVPILVMQGDRDFQIRADVDFMLLQNLLSGRDNVTFKLYEGLNHLFIPTTATNFVEHGSEIMRTPGIVDAQVLADIVAWILAQ